MRIAFLLGLRMRQDDDFKIAAEAPDEDDFKHTTDKRDRPRFSHAAVAHRSTVNFNIYVTLSLRRSRAGAR